MGLAHWDDVEGFRRAKGEMDATWQRLGEAASTKGVGLNRVRVAPGKLPTPPHSHGASEEVYFVLGGSGLAWQDDEVHEVRPRDCVIQRANELEHTFVAGPDGLDYLVYGTRHPTDFGWLPRSGAVRFGWPWVEGRTDDPWDREAEAPPLAYGEPAERPPNILNVDEIELEQLGSDDDGAARDERALRPGRVPLGAPRSGRARLAAALPFRGGGDLRHPRGRRDPRAVAFTDRCGTRRRARGRPDPPRPRDRAAARTRVGHAFQAGPQGITMLIYGTRKPNDMAWFPRSNKIFWRGLGVIGRIEVLDYHDGEPD